jgi:hypothetical protein
MTKTANIRHTQNPQPVLHVKLPPCTIRKTATLCYIKLPHYVIRKIATLYYT